MLSSSVNHSFNLLRQREGKMKPKRVIQCVWWTILTNNESSVRLILIIITWSVISNYFQGVDTVLLIAGLCWSLQHTDKRIGISPDCEGREGVGWRKRGRPRRHTNPPSFRKEATRTRQLLQSGGRLVEDWLWRELSSLLQLQNLNCWCSSWKSANPKPAREQDSCWSCSFLLFLLLASQVKQGAVSGLLRRREKLNEWIDELALFRSSLYTAKSRKSRIPNSTVWMSVHYLPALGTKIEVRDEKKERSEKSCRIRKKEKQHWKRRVPLLISSFIPSSPLDGLFRWREEEGTSKREETEKDCKRMKGKETKLFKLFQEKMGARETRAKPTNLNHLLPVNDIYR